MLSVTVGDADFPWLRDVRTVALAALANALGDSDAENALQRDFVEHQPYLFEPNHAFDFRLLSYQERLKTGYQENRRRRAAG